MPLDEFTKKLITGQIKIKETSEKEKEFSMLNESASAGPRVARKYSQYYKGWDDDVEHSNGKIGAHVYEFPDAKKQTDFLEYVGGAPHPLGGHRVILSGRKPKNIKEAHSDDSERPMDPLTKKIHAAHDKEVSRRKAKYHNYHAAADEYGVYSKTNRGSIETVYDPKTKKISHKWYGDE